MTRGHLLRTVSYLANINKPAAKGHLSCRDTLFGCPLRQVLLYNDMLFTPIILLNMFDDILGTMDHMNAA